MSITAPLVTEDSQVRKQVGSRVDPDRPLLRDPIWLFLAVGSATFAAMVVTAFILSAAT